MNNNVFHNSENFTLAQIIRDTVNFYFLPWGPFLFSLAEVLLAEQLNFNYIIQAFFAFELEKFTNTWSPFFKLLLHRLSTASLFTWTKVLTNVIKKFKNLKGK